MGYQSGFGLGKNKQGMTQPVSVEPHLSKRGLGLEIKNLEYSKDGWDFSLDVCIFYYSYVITLLSNSIIKESNGY